MQNCRLYGTVEVDTRDKTIMSGSQEQTNRRILQSLQERREKLRVQEQQQQQTGKRTVGPPMRSSGSRPSSRTVITSKPPDPSAALREQSEAQHMLLQQRAALQHAHSQSYGYYVTQDSQFGNLILPVLPRFEDKN